MTGNLGRDDARQDDDLLDRSIDDALRAELATGPRNLRAQVLARLEEPASDRPPRWLVLFRPAMLPVAGAALIVLGVVFSWWQVDEQLSRAGAGRGRVNAGRIEQPRASSTIARGAPASPGVAAPAGETTARSPVATPGRTVSRDDRVFAASWLGMDKLSRPKGIAADTVIADDDEPESFLPGAVGGDLGDPIKPIPRPRPIVIPPIVAAPIVAAPIVAAPIADAPPVSTLAAPVSTLSGDNSSRDQTGPGKSGGVRP